MMGVKRNNRSATLRILHEKGDMSRKRLAEYMKLTPPAITKIVAELLEEGWQSFGYNLDTMEFFLANDPFKYKVTFDGEIEVGEDFDELDAISSLTVKSVAFDGLGDAANIDGEVG